MNPSNHSKQLDIRFMKPRYLFPDTKCPVSGFLCPLMLWYLQEDSNWLLDLKSDVMQYILFCMDAHACSDSNTEFRYYVILLHGYYVKLFLKAEDGKVHPRSFYSHIGIARWRFCQNFCTYGTHLQWLSVKARTSFILPTYPSN